ncbi:MAG: hypothetical protein GY710_13570 [Desulfobacteraceae bacterium]|nr:hypothetical protein [Desulfobacteraceae bacterium]
MKKKAEQKSLKKMIREVKRTTNSLTLKSQFLNQNKKFLSSIEKELCRERITAETKLKILEMKTASKGQREKETADILTLTEKLPGIGLDSYNHDQIIVHGVSPRGKDGLRLQVEIEPENMFCCPGVLVQEQAGIINLTFIRTGIKPEIYMENPAFHKLDLTSSCIDIKGFQESTIQINHFKHFHTIFANGSLIKVRGTKSSTIIGQTSTNPWILCVHSNVAEGVGNPDMTAGHSWLTLHKGSTGALVNSYGLWPDDHPNVPDNGDAPDVRFDLDGDRRLGQFYYALSLTADHKRTLDKKVKQKDWHWTYTNTCASFASEVFDAVTGVELDADDWCGFETPRELGESIVEANSGHYRPRGSTPGEAGGGSSSW